MNDKLKHKLLTMMALLTSYQYREVMLIIHPHREQLEEFIEEMFDMCIWPVPGWKYDKRDGVLTRNHPTMGRSKIVLIAYANEREMMGRQFDLIVRVIERGNALAKFRIQFFDSLIRDAGGFCNDT